MERGCLMVTVACVRCAEPIVMGPWSVEEVHFLTNEQWGVNFVESTICNVCVGKSLAENNECYDDECYDDVSYKDEKAEADDLAAKADAERAAWLGAVYETAPVRHSAMVFRIPADGTLR